MHFGLKAVRLDSCTPQFVVGKNAWKAVSLHTRSFHTSTMVKAHEIGGCCTRTNGGKKPSFFAAVFP